MNRRKRTHPPLFGVMLRAFALVIVLGIGGMFTFFGLSLMAARPGADPVLGPMEVGRTPLVAAGQLGAFYDRQGSWAGVGELLPVLFASPDPLTVGESYALVDMTDRVVATNRGDLTPGVVIHGTQGFWRVPIPGRSGEAGALLVDMPPQVSTARRAPVPSDFMRAFVSAGLALGAVLLGLATLFTRRLSRPLVRLTQAAQALAGGDMSVRVDGGTVREIDELAGAFNGMAAALAAADTQRRQMTADVAHELRTPLSIIRGRLEGVQDGVYEANPEQVSALLDATALLERLIEDLRLLALADAGQLPLYPEPLEPAPLLHRTAAAFAAQAATAGVSFQIVADPDLPEVAADPQRVAQVLSNLVSNALRHTPAGGTITLEAAPDTAPGAPGLVFAVADTGSGIALEDLPHIFDRFWRADAARSRQGGGAGLGLAIARRIVEAHGGRIGVWSTRGEGTVVRFWLPLPTVAGMAGPPPAPVPAVTRRLVELVHGSRHPVDVAPRGTTHLAHDAPAQRSGPDS
ncbi:MAG TPA: HAMP domain-containing sensor histidine kinase [Chloroflexia bacterium]|nr:HAMP domain-containing sensor histidine kinase [Chloroflexia bacterium]